MLEKLRHNLAIGQNVWHAEKSRSDHQPGRQVSGPRNLVDEHEGHPEIGRFQGRCAGGDHSSESALHGAGAVADDNADALAQRKAPQDIFDLVRERIRCRSDFKSDAGTKRVDFASGLQQDGQDLLHFAQSAARKKTDEIGIAPFASAALRQILDHWMADENGAEAGGIIELSLEGKDAEHEVEVTRHLGDAAAVPGPDLGTDVVNDFQGRRALPQNAREPEIEPGIIDQDDSVGFRGRNFTQGLAELFPKISVALDHFPEADHSCRVDPIHEGIAGDRFHLRSTTPKEFAIRRELPQRPH